ncbi:MAG: DUF465 domain-containing protein [Candidatus Aminicenantes bacterium]|nr:DUF465 domain-containing protein [Candidatus Aminicenantes bacterium]
MDEKELKERMLRENEEFRNLFKQHQSFEKKLELLKSKSILTEEEKLEEKELKKRKLALKDRMYWMMAEFRKSNPAAR